MRDIGRRISLEDVVDQLPIGVFLTDPDGNCLAVNRHWCRYAGMTPEAAAGQGWVEAIHPRDRDRVSAAWNRAVKAGRRFELEYRFRSPTGRVVWLHASASTVIDSRDRLAGYVGSVVEITRLRKAESRIERSEREAKRANTLLADLLDVIPSAISLYDSDMRMVLCNAAYHDLYPQQREIAVAGSRVEDIIRYGLERGLYPPAQGREETWLRERLDYQRNLSEDVSERLIHSRRGWLQIRERRTADGGSVSIRTDVTQIKDAQEALSEQAAILEAASHHMDQGFLMLDANLRVVAHNARMAALLGVAEPVLRNKPDYEQVLRAQTVAGELLNPSGDPDALIFSSLRDLTVAEGAFSVERRRPNGAVIELRCSPLPDSGWVLTGIDVTRRKRTEEDLRRNLDAMGRLYAVTSSPDIAFEDKVSRLLALGSEIFGLPLGIVSRVTGQTYRIEYVHGPADAPRAGAAFDLGTTYCVHVFDGDAPRGFDHVGQSFLRDHPCYRTFRQEAYLGTPILVGDQWYGTLNFSSPSVRNQPFSEGDYSLIRLMAQWIGGEIHRNRVQARLAESEERFRAIASTAPLAVSIGGFRTGRSCIPTSRRWRCSASPAPWWASSPPGSSMPTPRTGTPSSPSWRNGARSSAARSSCGGWTTRNSGL